MKKPFLWAAAASVAGALFRSWLLLSRTEWGTGFLQRGSGLLAPLLVLALAAVWLPLSRALRLQAAELPEGGSLLQGAPALSAATMLLAAAGLALSAVMAGRDGFRLARVYSLLAVPAIFGLLALIPSSMGKRARPGAESYLALLPVLWGMAAMLCAHVANNTIITVPENALTVLGMAALLLYLYAEAKLRGLQQAGGYLSALLAAALLLTAAIAPQTLLRIWAQGAGRAGLFVSHCPAIDVAMTCFVPLLWTRAGTATRQLTEHNSPPHRVERMEE